MNIQELSYLSYVFRRSGIFNFFVVYNADKSLNKPITTKPGDLPPCTDACPINEDAITKPEAGAPIADQTFVPPTPAIVPITTPPTPATVPAVPIESLPTSATIPTVPITVTLTTTTVPAVPIAAPPTPATVPTVPIAVPPTPATIPDVPTTSGLKLSSFALQLVPLLLNADFRTVRRICYNDFDLGMKKLQTDLARLKLRKQNVVDKTSADDEKEDDLAYLDTLVEGTEKVLVDKYTDRKRLFDKDMSRLTTTARFQNLAQKEAEFIADRMDRLVHEPIAESKKFLNSERKKINNEMAV